MARYMLQHKSFSTLLFGCNMVLFGGLFSIPVFFLHYLLIIADNTAIALEAIVLIPAAYLAYHFAQQEEKALDRDSVAVQGGEIIVGTGLLSARPGRERVAPGLTQVRIDLRTVEKVQLKRSSSKGSLGSFYELVLFSDERVTSIPLNDWLLRNLKLTQIDSVGRYVAGKQRGYPGYDFVSEVYSLLQHVPWSVTSCHTGEHGAHKTDYEFRGIANPWAKEHAIESPSRTRRQLLAAAVAVSVVVLMGLVGSVYYRRQKAKLELEKQRAMERLMTERKRSKGL